MTEDAFLSRSASVSDAQSHASHDPSLLFSIYALVILLFSVSLAVLCVTALAHVVGAMSKVGKLLGLICEDRLLIKGIGARTQGKACYQSLPRELRQKILLLSTSFDDEFQYRNPGLNYINRHILVAVRVHELSKIHESSAADVAFVGVSWRDEVEALRGKHAKVLEEFVGRVKQWDQRAESLLVEPNYEVTLNLVNTKPAMDMALLQFYQDVKRFDKEVSGMRKAVFGNGVYATFVYPRGLDKEAQQEFAIFIVQKAESMRDHMITVWNSLAHDLAVIRGFAVPLVTSQDFS